MAAATASLDPAALQVLVLAPVGRDGALVAQMLARAGLAAQACADIAALCAPLETGGEVGALIVTEEALGPAALARLLAALAAQPAWSDLPVLALVSPVDGQLRGNAAIAALEAGANVTLVERPVRVRMLASAAHAALRARRRQYETRALFAQRAELLARAQAAQADAEAANLAKDEFLATVSHELRTPLNAMYGWTRMLRAGAVAPERVDHALETIERNAHVQTQLVEDLLDVSRIVAGKLHLVFDRVAIRHVVGEAIDAVRPAAAARGVELAAELEAGEGVAVLGDAARLQQIVWNLLSNAIKFTPRGGRVQVALAARADAAGGAQVEVRVTDTGAGIAPEFLPHVFERFRQQDGSITRAHGGLGLGLAIVRHLVELHQGAIEAHSAGAGRGATFTVRLPVAPREARGSQPPREGAPGARLSALDWTTAVTGLRVLVVDDEPDARALVGSMLERSGVSVVTASGAQEALDVVRGGTAFDVLVSDIGMPEVDGYALLAQLRAQRAEAGGGNMPAVALTAYARAEDRAHALRAGFDAHVPKPVDPAELLRVIDRLAASARE